MRCRHRRRRRPRHRSLSSGPRRKKRIEDEDDDDEDEPDPQSPISDLLLISSRLSAIVRVVNQNATFEETATFRLGQERKPVDPCSVVIFGASGDLTARKLIPALYHLQKEKQMPADFRILGFARREKTDASWREELRQALEQFSRTKPVDDKVWHEFSQHVFYCQGDITETEAYARIEKQLAGFGSEPLRQNLLFYLATMPSQFGDAVEQLHRAGLLHKNGA